MTKFFQFRKSSNDENIDGNGIDLPPNDVDNGRKTNAGERRTRLLTKAVDLPHKARIWTIGAKIGAKRGLLAWIWAKSVSAGMARWGGARYATLEPPQPRKPSIYKVQE